MTIFRLASGQQSPDDGNEASRSGGRWNHKGIPVIYAAESRALCALEVLSNAGVLSDLYVITTIDVPAGIALTRRSVETLPPSWNAAESTDETRDIGTAWAEAMTSAILAVPSVVMCQEYNYILNPRHPDFCKISFLDNELYSFDERLCRAWSKH